MAIYGARAFNMLKGGLLRDLQIATGLGLVGGMMWKLPADRQVREFQRKNNEETERARNAARKVFQGNSNTQVQGQGR